MIDRKSKKDMAVAGALCVKTFLFMPLLNMYANLMFCRSLFRQKCVFEDVAFNNHISSNACVCWGQLHPIITRKLCFVVKLLFQLIIKMCFVNLKECNLINMQIDL